MDITKSQIVLSIAENIFSNQLSEIDDVSGAFQHHILHPLGSLVKTGFHAARDYLDPDPSPGSLAHVAGTFGDVAAESPLGTGATALGVGAAGALAAHHLYKKIKARRQARY